MTVATISSERLKFFDFLLSEGEGYLCIAYNDPQKGKGSFSQSFFQWPKQRRDLAEFIAAVSPRKNVWFCPTLLSKAERKKEYCLPTNLVWADLDECDPDSVNPKPPVVLETSPGRFQALWRLDQTIDPFLAENYSKRIAYGNAKNGADPSGWDLTQLLRVPYTHNYKYEVTMEKIPRVELKRGLDVWVPAALFEQLAKPELTDADQVLEQDMPSVTELPDHQAVLYKYLPQLQGTFLNLYEYEPTNQDDWSKLLWSLINLGFEAGLDVDEVFAVVLHSKVNKYERDKRPIRYLWRDVLRADAKQKRIITDIGEFKPLRIPQIITDEEIAALPNTFINQYKDWASAATDAVEDYHELSAFILLSSVLAGYVRLETSYGEMIPNLWGLILGDSTLTRKTTAMRMAMDLLNEIDNEVILASDGSAEGLLTGLATRPGRTSIYFKDEVSGFFDSINRKDYLAGMPETLTHLYDVPTVFTRRLRKEVIVVQRPVFIFFGGGIQERVYEVVREEYVLSGFIPRFLVVSGKADMERLKMTGPSDPIGQTAKAQIREHLADLYENYRLRVDVKIGTQTTKIEKPVDAYLTTDAWARYGEIEMQMVTEASESPLRMLALPTFERMSRSMLKMATLIAASRQKPVEGTIQVEVSDVLVAAYYIKRWGKHTIDLLYNCGRSVQEKTLQRIQAEIARNPGILRSRLMQTFRLQKRDMDDIMGTLIDRGLVRSDKMGRGGRLWTTS